MVKEVKRLVFRLSYADKILTGKKITTIRLKPIVKEGEIIEIYVGHARVGRAIVKSVKPKKLSELSIEDAMRDGFSSINDLKKELEKIYGRKALLSNPTLYIIEFSLL